MAPLIPPLPNVRPSLTRRNAVDPLRSILPPSATPEIEFELELLNMMRPVPEVRSRPPTTVVVLSVMRPPLVALSAPLAVCERVLLLTVIVVCGWPVPAASVTLLE